MSQKWQGASAKVSLRARHPHHDLDGQEVFVEDTVGRMYDGVSVEDLADYGLPAAQVYRDRVVAAGRSDLLKGEVLYVHFGPGRAFVHASELTNIQRRS